MTVLTAASHDRALIAAHDAGGTGLVVAALCFGRLVDELAQRELALTDVPDGVRDLRDALLGLGRDAR
jgi:hypothetical protein